MVMPKASPRHCPRCGNTLLPHQRFCAKCGELVSDNARQGSVQEQGSGAVVEVAQEDFPAVQEIPSTPDTPQTSVVSHDDMDDEQVDEEEAIEDRPTTTFERPGGETREGTEAIEDRPTALFRKSDGEEGQGVERVEEKETARDEPMVASAGPQDTIISKPRNRQQGVVNPVSQGGSERTSVATGREWDGMSARARARNRNNPISRSGEGWGDAGVQDVRDVRDVQAERTVVGDAVVRDASSNGPVSDGLGGTQGVGIANEPVVNRVRRNEAVSQGGIANDPISSAPIASSPVSQSGRANNPVSAVPVVGGPIAQGSYASNAVSSEGFGQGANTSAPGVDSRSGIGPTRRRRNIIGVLAAIIVILVLLGVASYLLLPGLTNKVTPITQPPIKRSNIDTTANYAGVDVTIVNVQQTQHFINSADSNADGVVRLAVRAHNASDQAVNFDYHTLAHLLLPNGKEESPILVSASPVIAANATQAGTVDFAVPTSMNVGQLVFRLGDASKVQIDIPLNGQANLSRYQPQSSNMSQQVSYLGLNWMVSQITTQNNLNDQQANKGTRYITVTINVSNTVAQTVIVGSPYDYLTLQVGGKTLTPVYSTLPTSFDADATNVSGTVTFLVAQTAGKGTLTWSSSSASGFNQASTDLSFPS